MTVFGYARVSSTDQSCEIQEVALLKAGANSVSKEQKSGTTVDGRDKLMAILELLRPGDIVMVTRLDRLGRSLKDLLIITDKLKEKGASLKCLEQDVDTSSASGRAFFQMLGVFAEFETALRRERQMEGVLKAKAEGRYKGRPVTVNSALVRQLREQGKVPTEIARDLNISRASVYRALEG
jgi:DNA invertase Pin-like site-specific DNA recombinase